MKRSAKVYLGAVVGMIVLLLTAHVFDWGKLKIDNITMILVGALLVIPFFGSLRKIKLGEFEAEIAPREVAAVVAKASTELPVTPEKEESRKREDSSILTLVQQDPQLGLAKLRISIEEALRSIYRMKKPDGPRKQFLGLGRLVKELEKTDDLSPEMASSLRDVISLANRAVHGERVSRDTAENLTILGEQMLQQLWMIYESNINEPKDTRIIETDYLDRLSSSRYQVITAVPLVESPQIHVRILDQEGLNTLLDNYAEYAEFIVSVTPLDVDTRELHTRLEPVKLT